MVIGIWITIIILSILPSLISLIFSLILIKKKTYIKPKKNQIYAGFWFRLLAGVIDYIIIVVISIILAFLPVIGWILSIFLSWLYFAIQHSSSKQSTIGMRLCDLIIVDENHNKIGFWRAMGNYLLSNLSGLLIFIGFFMIAFTSRKQGLHNLITRTIYLKMK